MNSRIQVPVRSTRTRPRILNALPWTLSGSSAPAGRRRHGIAGLAALTVLGLLALVGPLPGAAALSPDRHYEKVSPNDKGGIDAGLLQAVKPDGAWFSPAAANGNAFAYASFGTNDGGAASSGPIGQALARRGATGWSVRFLNPPIAVAPFNVGFVWSTFSDDLSTGIVHCTDNVPCESEPLLTSDAVPDTVNEYWADLTGPANTYKLLFSVPPPLSGGSYGGEGSADLTHAAFELRAGQDNMVHEGFIDANGISQQRVASVVGGVEVEGALGLGYEGNNFNPGVISDDGTRILFSHPGCCTSTAQGDSTPPSDLYLRDTGPGGPSTTWVSEPEAGVPADPTSPRLDAFQGASSDASKVFFTSGEKLTADSTGDPTPDSESFGDLYQYDYDSGDLRDISVDTGNPDGARVRGVVGVSDSGGGAYFVAQGRLGTGGGTDPGFNLFHWQDGPGNGNLTFIAELDGSDNNVYDQPNTYLRSARVTPNGRYLLFESNAPLTGDDLGPVGDADIFRYDSSTDSLECVSCGPDASDVDAQLRTPIETQYNQGLSRNITDDGSMVFFETPEALVPEDTNGERDVYEWDAASGAVELVSDGKDPEPSYFGDAASDGSGVFFFTRAQLTSSDGDDNYDAYVARTGPPLPVTPGSSGFVGPGNQPKDTTPGVSKKKCKQIKNKKKRKKCIKKKKSKRRAE